MSKISIDGNIIGTDADKVDYKKNNAATVEDALDALFQGAGGGSSSDDEISNADLAMLASKLLVAGGAQSGKWEIGYYGSLANATVGSTFSESANSIDSTLHCKFRVHAGDTVHYNNTGESYAYAYALTDTDNKVVALPASKGKASGSVEVTTNGWCYAMAVVASSNYPTIYASWSERKTLTNEKKVLSVLGDSISSDSDLAGLRTICYPRILAKLMNCELDRRSQAGANLGGCLGYGTATGFRFLRSDADYVVILYGANDCTMTASVPVGDADDVMELDITTDEETLKSTFIGRYRFLLEKLRAMMAKDAPIFAVGPLPQNSQANEANLATMRSELSSLVTLMGGASNGYYYINGTHCLPYMASAFLDNTHPNEIGQTVLANTLYTRIKEVLGE